MDIFRETQRYGKMVIFSGARNACKGRPPREEGRARSRSLERGKREGWKVSEEGVSCALSPRYGRVARLVFLSIAEDE